MDMVKSMICSINLPSAFIELEMINHESTRTNKFIFEEDGEMGNNVE